MDDTKAEKAFQESMLLGEERGDKRVLAAVQWTVEPGRVAVLLMRQGRNQLVKLFLAAVSPRTRDSR